ncbi:protein ASPARTIC PROTEASE IN GUARD CELL 1-like [Rosa rugosa]|uniref:protein ASPARTIC PROTEASE IN GUARD CELL 1-like n=1 Tax=Rosa rugosa TaxID=74645 RepID=UPI002B4112AA|nr:protein ASPARTIC PROTEASE IN GUARD CELL 1-like [Rosa rugosa]
MIFGCGHSNVDPRSGYNPPGIVGLSREPSSLVGQISYPHVSYCISANNEGNHSSVKFGSVAVITENTAQTPLLTGPLGFYYVSLEGISVDGTMLDIPKSVFNMTPEGEGGVFMDTGTDHTQLVLPAFYAVTSKIEDILLDFKSLPDVDGRFPVCYNDTNFRLDSTPEIVFQFTGLEFPLSANNTWDQNSLGYYCLAILPVPTIVGHSVLGMYQQRNVIVGYDFNNNIVSLKYSDNNCA